MDPSLLSTEHHHHHDHPADVEHEMGHAHDHLQHANYEQKGQQRHTGIPVVDWLLHTFTPHSHSHHVSALDASMATDRGLRAVKISFAILLLTAVFQVFIVAISGSVALLADTIHNFSDALTALPLGLAFWLSRRAANKRYTYGYGRAEDIAGVIIVVLIFISAIEAIYQSILKIIHPAPLENLGWVAIAAVVGFIGNELVAIFRIRVGKDIGSAALVADGQHARTDGFTSLAVLAGAIGVWIGFPLLDPIIGLGIGVAILVIVWQSAREIWSRIMDAVDPEVTMLVTQKAKAVDGVMDVHDPAIRWVGHRQRAEVHITVDCYLPTYASHHIAEEVRHTLFHSLPALDDVTVHVDPCECLEKSGHHHHTEHHRAGRFLPTM